jgi:hypothetical protein
MGEFPEIPPQDPVVVENAIDWELTADDIDWEDDEMLELPEGLKTKVVNSNEAEQRVDFFVKFPPGYVEPRHTHDAAHADLICDGKMVVHGHELTPGDYIYGQKQPHGPMEFPEGCIVFCSYVGGGPAHRFDEDEHEHEDYDHDE